MGDRPKGDRPKLKHALKSDSRGKIREVRLAFSPIIHKIKTRVS